MKLTDLVIFAALSSFGVSGGGVVFAQTLPVKEIGPGWQCLLIPSSFDGPGTLFSVNAAGEKSRIVDLRALNLIPVRTGNAAFGRIASKGTIGGNVVVGLLEKAIPGLGLKLSAEGSNINGATIEYGNVEEEATYESEVNSIFDDWFNEHVKPKQGLRYFFVRDAFVAGSILYNLTNSNVEGAGAELTLKHIFEASAVLFRHEGEKTYTLDQSFNPPLRVCIRASEVSITRSAEGSEAYQLTTRTGQVPPITKSLD